MYELASADCVEFNAGTTVHVVLSRGMSFACTRARVLKVWTITLKEKPAVCTQLLAAVLGSEKQAREHKDLGATSFVFKKGKQQWLQFAEVPEDVKLPRGLTWRWRPKFRNTPPRARELVHQSQYYTKMFGTLAVVVVAGGIAVAMHRRKQAQVEGTEPVDLDVFRQYMKTTPRNASKRYANIYADPTVDILDPIFDVQPPPQTYVSNNPQFADI